MWIDIPLRARQMGIKCRAWQALSYHIYSCGFATDKCNRSHGKSKLCFWAFELGHSRSWCCGPPTEQYINFRPSCSESPACYLYVTCRFYDIWKSQSFNTKRSTSMINQNKRKRVLRCATNWLQSVCEDSGRVTCRRLNAMSAMIWPPRLWSLSCRLPCWKQRPKQPNVRGKCLADDQSSIELYGLYGTASLIWHELTPNCTPRPKEIQMPNALVVGYLWRSLAGLAGVVDRQHAFFDDVCIGFMTYNMYV